jgi:hypothetical protein
MTDERCDELVRYDIDTATADPALGVVDVVARLKGTDPRALPPVWNQIGEVLEGLFADPPAPGAGVEVSFDYAGYHVTVTQTGTVELSPVGRL